MTGTWPSGWQVGDIEVAAQFSKGVGAISDTTLGGSAATIDITSIVGTYAHLLAVIYGRGDAVATSVFANARFNGDTAANYDAQYFSGQSTTLSSTESFAATSLIGGVVTAASAGANLFASSILFIPHYAGTSNNKVVVGLQSVKYGTSSGNMFVQVAGGFWRSNAAITRVTLLPASGNFVAGTRVTLYGMG